jgi:hypothetical protein
MTFVKRCRQLVSSGDRHSRHHGHDGRNDLEQRQTQMDENICHRVYRFAGLVIFQIVVRRKVAKFCNGPVDPFEAIRAMKWVAVADSMQPETLVEHCSGFCAFYEANHSRGTPSENFAHSR